MMNCPICRKPINSSMEYCNHCGVKLSECYDNSETKSKKIYVLVAVLILLVGFFIYINGGLGIASYFKGKKCINMVKTGHIEMCPGMEIGPAFDDFFTEPSWEYGVTTDNEDMVEFKGICYVDKRKEELTIQFIVDVKNETFRLDYVGIGRDGFSWAEIVGMMENIEENYNMIGH